MNVREAKALMRDPNTEPTRRLEAARLLNGLRKLEPLWAVWSLAAMVVGVVAIMAPHETSRIVVSVYACLYFLDIVRLIGPVNDLLNEFDPERSSSEGQLALGALMMLVVFGAIVLMVFFFPTMMTIFGWVMVLSSVPRFFIQCRQNYIAKKILRTRSVVS